MNDYRDSDTRWKFADIEELVDYIANLFEIEPINKQSIRGTGSQVQHRRQVKADENNPAPFDNPVFDSITSPHGELVVGSQSFYFRAPRTGSSRRHLPDFDIPNHSFEEAYNLSCYQDYSGLDICESDDGSLITYTGGSATLSFRAYKNSYFGLAWQMGTKIKTAGLNYEAAIINSRYIDKLYGQVCGADTGQNTNSNNNELKEYWFGIGPLSSPPTRVESLCRVQWNNRRISGVVTIGSQCFTEGVEPWPTGYPADWPPLNQPDPVGTILIQPRPLSFTSRPSRPTVTKMINIRSTFQMPVTVTAENATTNSPPADPTTHVTPNFGGTVSGEFSNVSGEFTIPPGGSINIPVTFAGLSGFGSVTGNLRVRWSANQVANRTDVGLLGTLVQEAVL